MQTTTHSASFGNFREVGGTGALVHVKYHFLSKIYSISDPLPPDIIFVPVDVTSLYTDIPHTHGLAALEHFLDIRSSPRKPNTPFLLQLAVITMNKP